MVVSLGFDFVVSLLTKRLSGDSVSEMNDIFHVEWDVKPLLSKSSQTLLGMYRQLTVYSTYIITTTAILLLMLCLRRSTTNLKKRIDLLESSVYKSLKTDVKEKMIRQPHAGLVSSSLSIYICIYISLYQSCLSLHSFVCLVFSYYYCGRHSVEATITWPLTGMYVCVCVSSGTWIT